MFAHSVQHINVSIPTLSPIMLPAHDWLVVMVVVVVVAAAVVAGVVAFFGLESVVFRKAVDALAAEGKATLIADSTVPDDNADGVKFF